MLQVTNFLRKIQHRQTIPSHGIYYFTSHRFNEIQQKTQVQSREGEHGFNEFYG